MHSGWTPFYFMYDPKCSMTFPWCTIDAPAAFAWCTINVPTAFAWCTNYFVHKVEFSYIGWYGVHPLWNGNIFHATGPLCGEFTGPGEFPTQSPVTQSFEVFFDLRLNKWLSKQPWGWWFEMPSWSLWRHCDVGIVEYDPVQHDITSIILMKKKEHKLVVSVT